MPEELKDMMAFLNCDTHPWKWQFLLHKTAPVNFPMATTVTPFLGAQIKFLKKKSADCLTIAT